MGRTAALVAALVVLTTVSTALVPATAGAPAARGGDATAADADTRTPVPVDNSTARLVLSGDELDATGMATVQPDLGATLSTAGEDVHQRSLRVTVEDRFEAANSTNDRVIVIDQTLIELEAVSAKLLDRQHTAIRSYANGSIDEPELLRRLARLDQVARDMLKVVSYLRSRSNEIEGQPLSTTINAIEARLDVLKGPVRREVARTLQGTASMDGIYVQVSGRNLVLATVDEDGRYLREAYVISNRDTEGFRDIDGPHDALDRLSELYPWASNNTAGTIEAAQLADVYRMKQPHRQGSLVAYFDAYSGDVFYEIQSISARTMPTETIRNVTDGGLRVVVERTYPGGPMWVAVANATTGHPVDARITVEGVEVGSTDAEGQVLTVEPRTDYEVVVETSRTSTNVTVDPPSAT